MPTLAHLVATFEKLWPVVGAEDWDAPGLLLGSLQKDVQRVMLTVDVTSDVVACATEARADLLIAHHPFLMRGVKTLAETTAKGSVVTGAIHAGLAIYSAHTNADIVENGVSDVIAKTLGLTDIRPLVDGHVVGGPEVGTGRVGVLPDAMTLGEFAALVAKILPHTASGVRVAGDYNRVVERVALCGGAGDSFIGAAQASGADVYVTSDLRHHVVQDAREQALLGPDLALIDVSHWASEFLWLDVAAQQLRNIYSDVVFEVCDLRTDPWDFVVTQ